MALNKHRKSLILSEVGTWPEWKQDFFFSMVDRGTSLPMAHLLASRQTPALRTDTQFMASQHRFQDLPEWQQAMLASAAKKRGYTPKGSDTYHPGMADGYGDPDAFYNQGEGISKIKAVARKRGSAVGGIVEMDGPKYTQEPSKREHVLHPRIVERIRKEKLAADPSLERMDQNELRHDIVKQHGPK